MKIIVNFIGKIHTLYTTPHTKFFIFALRVIISFLTGNLNSLLYLVPLHHVLGNAFPQKFLKYQKCVLYSKLNHHNTSKY